MELNKIYHENCEAGLSRIEDSSVDVVLTDPPYLYLKNQKLDVPFDEDVVFAHFKRILKDSGFVVMFGRGESFYRWNTKLAGMGLKFKEEVILLERLLALVSKEGDVVVDPFIGSGSTAIAAHNLNRNFIGFELDEEYYGLAVDRVSKAMRVPKQAEIDLAV
jgi:DNA modification methylase